MSSPGNAIGSPICGMPGGSGKPNGSPSPGMSGLAGSVGSPTSGTPGSSGKFGKVGSIGFGSGVSLGSVGGIAAIGVAPLQVSGEGWRGKSRNGSVIRCSPRGPSQEPGLQAGVFEAHVSINADTTGWNSPSWSEARNNEG